MRPVLQNNKLNKKLWILYALIFIICTIGIGVALYAQFYSEENIGAAIGIVNKDSEEDKKLELKEDFNKIFTNQLENLQNTITDVEKINEGYDIVVTAYRFEKNEETCEINVFIPYINVNDDSAREFNARIKEQYKKRAEDLVNQESTVNIIYSVEYKAYIQNDILSLAICSEFKEGEKSQKVIVQTFNYNLKEKRSATINDILNLKNISLQTANNKIKSEIKTIQEQNQPLIDQGYPIYSRDYNSEIYRISDNTQFLYGKDGILYVIYAYGNDIDTSEMDLVIFN